MSSFLFTSSSAASVLSEPWLLAIEEGQNLSKAAFSCLPAVHSLYSMRQPEEMNAHPSLLGASLYDIFGASWSTKGGIFKLIYRQERDT